MVMQTKDNRNKPHHSEHLSIWFSQSVQHHTKCRMNTELRHLHFQKSNTGVKNSMQIQCMQMHTKYKKGTCLERNVRVPRQN